MDGGNVRQQQERVRIDALGKDDRRQVLVDDGLDPTRARPEGGRLTGIPPPPEAMTIVPLAASIRMDARLDDLDGSGEGTTRRHPGPSGATVQPFSPASCLAVASSYIGPTGFDGVRKAGS